MYQTEVLLSTLPVDRFLREYCFPEKFLPACRACPHYHTTWSCPPDVPPAEIYLKGLKTVYIIGIKVLYDEETRERAVDAKTTEYLQQQIYGKVKRALLETLLRLEQDHPASRTIAAGRCELCTHCTRMDGQPCIFPHRMRYSFSGLGFDLVQLSEKLLHTPLLWAAEGLPEYQMALAAFAVQDTVPIHIEIV